MTPEEALFEAQRRFGPLAFAKFDGLYRVGSGRANKHFNFISSPISFEDAFAQCDKLDAELKRLEEEN
jgi:hypothetical protein